MPISADCRRPHCPRAGKHEIDLLPAAARADEPLVPVANGGVGAVTLSHYRWIGLDPVVARPAPDHDPCAGCGGAAECCGRSGVGVP